MDIRFHRHEAYLLHLPDNPQLDRRLLVLAETAFDGHVVLSLGDWCYHSQQPDLAQSWSFAHLPSGGFSFATRRRIEAALPSIPPAYGLLQLSPVPAFDRRDGEWLSQYLWAQFRRPSIVWLNIPYAARERAKKIGVRWNAQARRWFGVRSPDLEAGLANWTGATRSR